MKLKKWMIGGIIGFIWSIISMFFLQFLPKNLLFIGNLPVVILDMVGINVQAWYFIGIIYEVVGWILIGILIGLLFDNSKKIKRMFR